MSNTVPEGWEVKTVGDIGSVVTGSTPSTTEPLFWGGATPFISPADFDGKIYIDKTSRTLSEEGTKKARELPKDAILVTCIGSLGGMALTSKPSVTNQQINAVVAEENQESRFHFYNILFNMHELIKSAGTTTLPIINKSTFSQINLLFPPLPEQQEIATILSSVDDVIEKTRAQIDKLKDLKTGMMQELLTKGIGHTEFKDSPVGRIPLTWSVVSLGEIIGTMIGGVSVNGENRQKGPNEIGVLRVSSVFQGEFFPDEHKTVVQEDLNRVKENPVKDHILFSRANTPQLVGESAYIERTYTDLFLPDKIWMIDVKDRQRTYVKWLSYVLCSGYVRATISDVATGTSGSMKNISKPSLLGIKTALPSLPEQIKIADILQSVDKRLSSMENKLSCHFLIKKALMQDLLTGKVRVQSTD